ncbi:hypothetical protein [Streptomyces sp. NPDC048142]|uniref:hypothetical protein n=1 Tax=Streptomyces sp. NPDC048142 TaxID=3365501 RepID=UPI00371DD641
MLQCTAVALLKPPDFLFAVSAVSVPGSCPEAGHVLCELGEDHVDDHATMLWDEGGRPGSAVWVRWNTECSARRLVSYSWCSARDARREACELFAGHRSAHSWSVTDPTDEAITQTLAALHPQLFPEYRDGEGRPDL